MSTALYRRYRPETFAEVIGQDHVTGPLMQALRTGRVTHAYLFSGPRGCGKTTSARILARTLNCARNTPEDPTDTPCGECPSCVDLARGGSGSLDVVEIDAASHGGVDDARDLRERATFAPTRDRYKIFIIDEAHMVSPAGFNALLKIVEEPPPHIKFVFATTEPDKVIGTIRSRTHHYPFRLVPPDVLGPYLEELCVAENVTIGSGVVPLVTRAGGGSVRDSLSVLDQLIAGAEGGTVDYERAVELLGFTNAALLDDVVDALAARDGASLFRVVDHVIASGHEPRRFVEDLLERLRDLIIIAVSGDAADAVLRDLPADQFARMGAQATNLGMAELSRAADLANTALTEMAGATSPRLHLELLCARMLLPGADDGVAGFAARLDRLERGELAHAVSTGGVGSSTPEISATAGRSVGGDSAPGPSGGSVGRSAGLTGAAAARAAIQSAREGAPEAPAPSTAPTQSASSVPPTAPPATPPVVPATSEVVSPAPAAEPEPVPVPAPITPVADPAVVAESAPTPGVAPALAPEIEPSPAPAPVVEALAPAGPAAPVSDRTPPESGPPAPAERPQGSVGAMTTEDVRHRWDEILGTLRTSRATWSLVKDNGQVAELVGDTLVLAFPSEGLARTFSNPRHTEAMQEAIYQTIGLQVRVEARTGAAGGPAAPDRRPPSGEGTQASGGQAPAVAVPADRGVGDVEHREPGLSAARGPGLLTGTPVSGAPGSGAPEPDAPEPRAPETRASSSPAETRTSYGDAADEAWLAGLALPEPPSDFDDGPEPEPVTDPGPTGGVSRPASDGRARTESGRPPPTGRSDDSGRQDRVATTPQLQGGHVAAQDRAAPARPVTATPTPARTPAPEPTRPTGADAARAAVSRAAEVARTAPAASGHAGAQRPTGSASTEIDPYEESSTDDPDLVSTGLVGVPLVVKTLKGTVLEEKIDDA